MPVVSVRLSDADLAYLKRGAGREPLSAYIRRVSLAAGDRAVVSVPAPTAPQVVDTPIQTPIIAADGDDGLPF